MGTLLQSTLNTRALPTGNLRYIRSDYPGKLTDQEVKWLLQNDITTVVDLREEKEYIAKPCRLEDEEGFVYYHLPVTGGGDTPNSPDAVAETYLAMMDEHMDSPKLRGFRMRYPSPCKDGEAYVGYAFELLNSTEHGASGCHHIIDNHHMMTFQILNTLFVEVKNVQSIEKAIIKSEMCL